MTEQELFGEVAKLVDYDPETGVMTWRWRDEGPEWWNARYAGKACGKNVKGHIRLAFRLANGKRHSTSVHRLAWYIVYGHPPKNEIDHLNRNRADNRINNLRCVTRSVNLRNASMKRNNTSGVTGVYLLKGKGKWLAKGWANGKSAYLGLFDDIAEAEAAVKAFRAEHGFADTHGERT